MLEDTKKLENYNKLLAERDMLKSDNNLLKNSLKSKDKHYMLIINEKNKRIKELESQLYTYKNKQVDIFGELGYNEENLYRNTKYFFCYL